MLAKFVSVVCVGAVVALKDQGMDMDGAALQQVSAVSKHNDEAWTVERLRRSGCSYACGPGLRAKSVDCDSYTSCEKEKKDLEEKGEAGDKDAAIAARGRMCCPCVDCVEKATTAPETTNQRRRGSGAPTSRTTATITTYSHSGANSVAAYGSVVSVIVVAFFL